MLFKRKNGNIKRQICTEKRLNTSLKDPSKALINHGGHGFFSFLSSLPISVLRNLELEANDFTTFLLDNIFIQFGTKLYRQVVGIPMGTNCAPLVADLFLFCYERDFMVSLSDDKQAGVIDAFYTTFRYLDDILNINNVYFDNMVSQIYPSELRLNKANTSDTKAAFLDLHLSVSNGIVSTKIYDKHDDFDFKIVNFPF